MKSWKASKTFILPILLILFVCFYSRLIWRSHYYISCSMSTSGAGPSSSNRVQHQQGSNSSSGQTEANGNTTPSPPPQSSTNPAATATPPVKEAKEAKPNPKMSKALSTSAKRYVTCCSIPVWHFNLQLFISYAEYRKSWQKSHWIPLQTAGMPQICSDNSQDNNLNIFEKIFQCWTQRW